MSVKYLLTRIGNKIGMNPAVANERAVLLGYLNEAAPELYNQADFPGSLMEQAFKVNGNQTISMPHYVGPVRAARDLNSRVPVHLNQMRPRYNQFNWTDGFRNIRFINTQPLMASVTNQSVGVLTVHAVETPPVTVYLSGPTSGSSMSHEAVVMDSVSKNTTNNFLDYTAVRKDRVSLYDVTLSDVDAKVLTVIPNNQTDAKYQILDVSECPWLSTSTSPQDNYMEILYKRALTILSDDSDEFPAFNCDDILVNKILQLWGEEQGKADMAVAYDQKATRSAARMIEEQNRATEDKVGLVRNPHDTVLPRVGSGRSRRGWWRNGY